MVQAVLKVCVAVNNFGRYLISFEIPFKEWLINLVFQKLVNVTKYPVLVVSTVEQEIS